MLRRFSLYGFLKNQQYYDYSLVLALLAMQLDYATIGLLVGVREGAAALLEIPSGVLADRTGRRRAMLVSLGGYILSFALFGSAGLLAEAGQIAGLPLVGLLMLAMLLFAVGDAFRSGTHKAMIFSWLRNQGREDERTAVYGYTRSWSKLGSALSVLIACGIIWWTGDFILVFFFAIAPYLLNMLNLATYPAEVDEIRAEKETLGSLSRALWQSLKCAVKRRPLRRLVIEAMGFDGFFKASKDYLQPVLFAAALPLSARLFAHAGLNEAQRSVVLLGPVYVTLFLLSALASRHAHRVVRALGGSYERASRELWAALAIVFGVLLWALRVELASVAIAGFIALYVVQNLWRPVLLSRLDRVSDGAEGATILSIESQARSLFTLALAPLLGALVDHVRASGDAGPFWPVPAIGFALAFSFWLLGARGDLGASTQAAR
ncbi:MAG: MFS transporter [Deltaproteobacteria bacterium]|nr:MFS transporter [Deltaproteobacteria bacterium]